MPILLTVFADTLLLILVRLGLSATEPFEFGGSRTVKPVHIRFAGGHHGPVVGETHGNKWVVGMKMRICVREIDERE